MADTGVRFFTLTSDAWEAMLADIYSAEKSIDIEQYIFAHDIIGERFVAALLAKARQGLLVRLHLDAVGSYALYRSDIADELRSAGIQIKFFNPVSPWRVPNFTTTFFRDHRKIMVVDGTVGHIGGLGIRDDMASWRDTHIRLEGEIVSDILENFETMWAGVRRWNVVNFRPSRHFVKKIELLANAPVFRERYVYQAYIAAIRNAKKYAYLATPYFVPDERFFRVLRLAARRGVDVRLIVPRIVDHVFIDHGRESFFTRALRAGIRIYIYEPSMMHGKTAVIDDEWCTVGSFNLDSLSFFYNYEANIVSSDEHIVAPLRQNFLDDLSHCTEVRYETWIRRPLGKKIMELLTWPLHRFM